MSDAYKIAASKMAEKLMEAQEALTELQLTEMLEQLFKSGDIHKYIRQGESGQVLSYVPYREKQKMEAELAEVKLLLADAQNMMNMGRYAEQDMFDRIELDRKIDQLWKGQKSE